MSRFFYYKDDYIEIQLDWTAWEEFDEFIVDPRIGRCPRIKNVMDKNDDAPWGNYASGFRKTKIEFRSKKELIKFLFLKHPEKFT